MVVGSPECGGGGGGDMGVRVDVDVCVWWVKIDLIMRSIQHA